jgi:DNA-binding MarR family transcriptional regulator
MSTNLETLGRAVKRAQHRQHRAVDTALAMIDTSIVQWDALRAIDRAPGASAHELALATFQSDQSFGTLANRLEARGLIKRQSGDGRRIEHHLTSAGERKLCEANVITEQVRAELFAPLTQSDRGDLQRILDKLLA